MSNYKRFYNNSYKYVFITIVTYNRAPILINNIELLRIAFKYAMSKCSFKILAASVLEDHLHTILELDEAKKYSEIIRLMKYYFSRHIQSNKSISVSKNKKREKGIWQRRFWEHTIRDENDLNKHIDYIHYNSYKHYKILPQEWEFSTFNKFVDLGYYDPNWCNFNDINHINDLDFE